MGISPSKTVLDIKKQQLERQISFLEQLSKALNKTPQEAEEITWMMQNKQYNINYLMLGTGGNGVVIRGYDQQEDKPIAIKIMKFSSDDQCERLLNEFKLLQTCKGSRILRVKEIYISYKFKLQFMIMEYCLFDLKKYLQNLNERRVALPMPFLLSLCSELIYGLRQIHEKNIIHLDIKPANILFSISKLWKFSDFGLSRKFKRTVVTQNKYAKGLADNCDSPDNFSEKITQYMKIIPEGYTALYASPEQYQVVKQHKFNLSVNDKSDIYSLGMVFLELTGVKVSSATVQKSKIDPTVDISPELNPGYNKFNELVLLKMLQYDPNARPTLEELQITLAKMREKGGMASGPFIQQTSMQNGNNNNNSNQEDRASEIDYCTIAGIQEDEGLSQFSKQEYTSIQNPQAMDLTEQNIPEIDAATSQFIDVHNINQKDINFIKIK